MHCFMDEMRLVDPSVLDAMERLDNPFGDFQTWYSQRVSGVELHTGVQTVPITSASDVGEVIPVERCLEPIFSHSWGDPRRTRSSFAVSVHVPAVQATGPSPLQLPTD